MATHPPRADAPRSVADCDRMVADAIRAQQTGRRAEAAALLERVLHADDRHHEALCRYAMLALEAGRADVAATAAERAASVEPGSAATHNLLGVALRQSGRLADAIARLTTAVALDPAFVDAQTNLGSALLDAGDHDAALACYRQALALAPRAAAAHNNLGNLYREMRRPTEAIAAYRAALALDPKHAWAHANLGNMLRDLGDADAAIAQFRASITLAPNRAEVWSNLLLTLNGSDRATPAGIAAEHRAFGAHFARLLPPLPPRAESAVPSTRLRVGYVSADFRRHAVATFFEPLLDAHDRSRFEIFCYYNQPRGDDLTERIRQRAEHFLPVSGLNDRQLAERIRHDGIDMLIDLTGHTAGNRLPTFFLKPAPVQLTWLGYLGGTGVPTMDHRITDCYATPDTAVDAPGLEPPWRLPRTQWCYRPYPEAPEVGPLPATRTGYITFACLNSPGKSSPATLAAWGAILRAVPGSRLILLASPDAARSDALRNHFVQNGIDAERIELVARMPVADYLALYNRADIGLDTFPFTGGTTTCDAAWMGVPVVTLPADRPFASSGATILSNLQLPELIATTTDDYVNAAVALAANVLRLAQLRAGLRDRMRASPLGDAAGFARDFEEALTAIWARHRGGGER
jgi:predicted O-linked N-acetylglucosamine transferase (SPINDLY family)